ncbi:MAG TPA: redoxin domain-containing protein [Acidimicrobiales bacterium]
MSTALLALRLGLAAVLLFAAAAKLLDRKAMRRAVTDLGLPASLAAPIAFLLPIAEAGTAALLIPGSTALVGAAAAILLLGAFTALLAMNLAKGRRPNCNCFGQAASEPISPATLVRNGALLAAALAVFVGDMTPVSPSSWAASRLGDSDEFAPWVVAIVLLLVAQLLGIVLIARRGGVASAAPTPSPHDGATADTEDAAVGLPVGTTAPEFALPGTDGDVRTLDGFLAAQLPLLLLFTDPHCGPCAALMPDVARWQHAYAERARIVVLSRGDPDQVRAKAEEYDLADVLVDADASVAQAYNYRGTPGAVVVSPEGIVASDLASGTDDIRSLVVAHFGSDVVVAGGVSGEDLTVGDEAPLFTLPSTHDHPVSLEHYRGRMVLLVFWDTTCGYCLRMLPELRQWEAEHPDGPNVLLVSTGSVPELRAQGWQSHVLVDEGRAIANVYGAAGTPMGVLIDAEGRIASELAVGAEEVLTIAERGARLTELASAFPG